MIEESWNKYMYVVYLLCFNVEKVWGEIIKFWDKIEIC